MVRQRSQKSPAPKTSQAISSSPQQTFQSSGILSAEAPKNPDFQGLSNALPMPMQAKLTVGEPNDQYEQEADRVAAQVVQHIHAPVIDQSQDDNSIQRKEESPNITPLKFSSLQRKTTTDGNTVSSGLESSINHERSTGKPLPNSLRPKLENAFGSDLGSVRIHDNAGADQLNQSIQAKAFTTGQDIFFKKNEYQPQSISGQQLLAHELTHVIQQDQTKINTKQIQRKIDETKYRIFSPIDADKYVRILPVHENANKKKNKFFPSSEKYFPGMYKSNLATNNQVLSGLGLNPSNYPHLNNDLLDKYEEEVLTKNPVSDESLNPTTIMEGGPSPYKEYKFKKSESDSIHSLHISYGNRIVTLTPRGNPVGGVDYEKAKRKMKPLGNGAMTEHDPAHCGTHFRGTPPKGSHQHFISPEDIDLSVIDNVIDALEKYELIGKRTKKTLKRTKGTLAKLDVEDRPTESPQSVALKVRKAFNTPKYKEEKQFLELAKSFMERQKQDPYGGLTSSVPTPDVPE